MIAVDLPPHPAGTWLAVYLERHDVAGRPMWSTTIRCRGGRSPSREWFSEEQTALAYALGQADARCLPLFDLRDPGGD